VPDAETLIKMFAIFAGTVAVLKVGWSVAQFFIGLAEGVKNLTAAVRALTERFDEHARDITDGLSDVRERVAALESWRRKEANE
jgi:hypothetical protein